ncbi:hypothetical protein H310_06855 [Aphanomyces invadans]|uniref:Uncharacterized protein n=1 Tax=Aphanomyces invadans TaxID=157072 RepID=A0A024U4E8_9STRA|nr:hypothetical protein H310_06855 [Aphanomyces invadans]ETW01286.1 hypothetical protein H310_06855 [Aphanomyces invadans]|eukprot:XP_008870284.1 hypothetical protein H310_06855 [Aphanomyces invadans]
MEEEDCFGFGSYDEIFSHPVGSSTTTSNESLDGGDVAGAGGRISPGSNDVSSATAIDVGTHLLENSFFLVEDDVKFSTNEALFHGRHIGLKVKQNGKLVTFNFPTTTGESSLKMCIDSNSGTHALGDLYLDRKELFWRPMRHSDTMQTSSGQVYGSDRYSLRIGLEHVREVVPTKIQNVVLALSISISVMDIAFEFSFMPGPYHKSSKRDDLMVLLQETLSTANTMQNALSAAASSSMDALNSDLLSLASNPDVAAPPPLSREIAAPRPTRMRPEDISQRNALIRSYLRLNPMSDEALGLASHILQAYEYPIGPTCSSTPSFLDDKEYSVQVDQGHGTHEDVVEAQRRPP